MGGGGGGADGGYYPTPSGLQMMKCVPPSPPEVQLSGRGHTGSGASLLGGGGSTTQEAPSCAAAASAAPASSSGCSPFSYSSTVRPLKCACL